MNFNWPLRKLSDVAEIVGGGTPSTKISEYYGGMIPWITPKDLSSHTEQYISSGERSLTDLGLKMSGAKLLPKGSVLFSSRAPIGYVAIAKNDVATNQGFKSLILKDGNDPEFFYYLLKANTKLFESRASGSTFKEVSGQVVKDTELRIPPYSIQKRVSYTLGRLDRKIENNRKTNDALEKIATAIFKSWFVDFDIVRVKATSIANGGDESDASLAAISFISGKNEHQLEEFRKEKPQHFAALLEVAKLFPSSFSESELGAIPLGWRISNIGEVVTTVGGGTPSTKNEEYWFPQEFNWTSPKDLSNINSPILLSTEKKLSKLGLSKVSSGLLPVGTLLMSSRAPIGYLAITEIPVAINQGYIAMLPEGTLSPLYMYFWCKENMSTIEANANGSTFMEISKKAFRPMRILVPSDDILKAFSNKIEQLFKLIISNEKQSNSLSLLRDALIPKLLSGELQIGNTSSEEVA